MSILKKITAYGGALILVACGAAAILPVWTSQFNYTSSQLAYLSEDNQSIYRVGANTGIGATVVIQELDLNGDQLGQWDIDLSDNPITPKFDTIIAAQNNTAFLISKTVHKVLFIDPVNKLHWYQSTLDFLESNEVFKPNTSWVDSDGMLLLVGEIITLNNELGIQLETVGQATLKINQQGVVVAYQFFSDLKSLSLFEQADMFIGVADFTEEVQEQTGELSTIIHFDKQLNVTDQMNVDFDLTVRNILNGNLVSIISYPEGNGSKLVSLQGEIIEEIDFNLAYLTFHEYADGFFTADSILHPQSDSFRSIYDRSVRVCNYTKSFELKWCKLQTEEALVYSVRSSGLVDGDSFGITAYYEKPSLIGLNLSLDAIMQAIELGLNIAGKETRRVDHFVYNNEGDVLLDASEKVYSHTGTWSLPLLFLPPEVSEEKHSPGVCDHQSTLFFPDNTLVSLDDYCLALSSSQRASQVSMWQW